MNPVLMALGVLLAVGVGLGQWPLAAGAAIAGIGLLAFLSMRQTQGSNLTAALDSVSNDNRVRIAPIRRLHREISEIVAANSKNAAIHVIGPEAVQEADQILSQSVRMLQLRDDLTKALRSRDESDQERAELEGQLITASPEEAASLNNALDARKLEAEHYSSAQMGLDRIDAGLRQAEAALSELKARLAVSATDTKDLDGQDQSLSETIARLHVLGDSLEEAEAALKEGMA